MNGYSYQLISTALMLFLVLDPIGNLPLCVSLLKKESPRSYIHIIARESVFAFVILLVFLLFGGGILRALQITETSLKIAGAVILFLIALKMVFGAPILHTDSSARQFFIVPLAVPLIAGPSSLAMVIILRGAHPLALSISALMLAWLASTAIMLGGQFLQRLMGKPLLDALESLMGFLLAILSVEMMTGGIRALLAR